MAILYFQSTKFSLFRSRSLPVATEQVSAQSNQSFFKRCRKIYLHLGFPQFVCTRRPNAHHQVSIQLDYRGDVQNMNSQHRSHINV